jgi:hypothetical protein
MENEKMKQERFIKIAENRTNRILLTLKLLGNCSNKNNYSYTDEEIKVIFSAIETELKNTKNKFVNKNKTKFSLR